MIALGRHRSLSGHVCKYHGINTMITHSVVGFKPKKFDFVHQVVSSCEGAWSGHDSLVPRPTRGTQHNCVSYYIPYLDAFEFTWQVAVGDCYAESHCQGATRGES